ncbi:carboxypeptidase-like regulatory domain-containing protein [Antarcticibacterium sp. 1MA-6-2]|uniref:carboxypeptidase-like regulatory domain-containing protein n=1 Tax=Antarcticibacterium sp. 1MA-6-2 TaxID=2908210 RepID=UPI0028834E7E|nr:carboxypeptidase-like regulatory domain-containing protein [Antarcticibacterium sp. 1MA-6-2]
MRGKVVDAATFEPVENVTVAIENTTTSTTTDLQGNFKFSQEELTSGNTILIFSAPRYAVLRLPVSITEGAAKDLDLIPIERDMFREQMLLGTISLGDDQLSEEEGNVDNVAGLLQASRDVFLNAAAFDFSQTFFRPRGLDSEFGKVYINGVEMNKLFNGRPQWSNWGGLNDVQRNQIFNMGSLPAEVGFGGLAGSTNIVMRAAKYSNGGRISYAAANRSYTGRVMATYNSGETPGGWAYSVSISRRFAEEAYVEGTLYSANALFLAVEKLISPSHSINFTSFYTPNTRGKSSANTQEVYDLRGQRYNSFWGYQNGEIRNSRIREIKEPVFMLNHFWKISGKTDLNTNLAYQFGSTGNSRIDYGGTRLIVQQDGQESFIGGGGNPDPSYYQNLPSYFLRFEDNQNFEAAYRARNTFVKDGQVNWESLYTANIISSETGGNSVYVIAEDRNDDQQITVNSILTSVLSPSLKINSKVKFTRLTSHNFAAIKDLLGGAGYLDIDAFAEGDATTSVGDRAQSDLRNRNRVVTEGEKFKYNFELHADVFEGYSQLQYKGRRVDLYAAKSVISHAVSKGGSISEWQLS